MQALLSPAWRLTTDHAASSDGEPVLEDRATGQPYHSQDLVQVHPSFGFMPAGAAVRRLAWTATLDRQGRNMVARFCGEA